MATFFSNQEQEIGFSHVHKLCYYLLEGLKSANALPGNPIDQPTKITISARYCTMPHKFQSARICVLFVWQ